MRPQWPRGLSSLSPWIPSGPTGSSGRRHFTRNAGRDGDRIYWQSGNGVMGTAQGTVDAVALVYAIVVFPAPFFWPIVHPAIRFWRRFGNRSFWVALPLWTFSGTCRSEERRVGKECRSGRCAEP